MKRKMWALLSLAVLIQSCALVSMVGYHEHIAGVEIVSIEEIENTENVFVREIRGVIPQPYETDEEWILAFRAIHAEKKVPGMTTVVKIFLEEDNWEIGKPFAVGKFAENKQASIKVDGRLLQIKVKP